MICSRLAPSPTGCLHPGNARSFLLAWLQSRAVDGKVILRIEDLDQGRAVANGAETIVEELRWLGLDWDNEVTDEYIQSQRGDLYREQIAELQKQHRLYPCYCSRRELRESMSAPHGAEPVYAGTCRELTGEERTARSSRKDPALRFRVEPGDVIEFTDLIHGPQHHDLYSETGDFIVARADGVPSYHLGVVIDDIAHGVTHVLRGDDLLSATPRQIALYRAFHQQPPTYTHVPLLLGPDGERLAKRNGARSLSQLRDEGWNPDDLIGLLAWSAGLIDEPEPLRPHDLLPDFSIGKIRASAATQLEMSERLTIAFGM